MGEIIKSYNEIEIYGKKWKVELNEPLNRDVGGNVHFHNGVTRIDMSQQEFYLLVEGLNHALKVLDNYKNGEYV